MGTNYFGRLPRVTSRIVIKDRSLNVHFGRIGDIAKNPCKQSVDVHLSISASNNACEPVSSDNQLLPGQDESVTPAKGSTDSICLCSDVAKGVCLVGVAPKITQPELPHHFNMPANKQGLGGFRWRRMGLLGIHARL